MSQFPLEPQFEDPQSPGITMSLPEHVEADLQGLRNNPDDNPVYLAKLLAAILLELPPASQKRIAQRMGLKEV